jgi:putative hydrolase of the HAD superfamily
VGRAAACLLDAYNTILHCDFSAHEAELPARAGVPPDAWYAGIVRVGPLFNTGRLTKAEGFAQIMAANGVEPRPEVVRALVDLDRELLLANSRLYDDTVPFLTRLRARGIQVAVVSNCSEHTRELLDQAGIAELADAVVLSCEVGAAKPDAEVFRAALSRLGAPPSRALFVDDQPAYCAGAAALGISAVQIARGELDGKVPTPGTPLVRSLSEVEPLLG